MSMATMREGSSRRWMQRLAESDKPDPDLLQDHHRLRLAEQGGQGRAATARRWARTKWPPHATCSTGTMPPFEIPAEIYAGWDHEAGRQRTRASVERRCSTSTPRPTRSWPLNSSAAWPASCRPTGHEKSQRPHRRHAGRGPGGGLAQGFADGAGRVRPAAAGTDRRLGRPGRLQPDHLERLPGCATATAPTAATTCTTACASSA